MDFMWRAALVFLGGFLLIRIIGRKSVAQLTVSTTVVMIAVGAILVQPIVVDTVPRTLIVIAIFIAILIIMEFLQMKSKKIEAFLHGKAKIVIQEGKYVVPNLKKLRITASKIEMQLRKNGITHITDIKTATVEPNGQLGYELIDDKKPLTVGEFKRLMAKIIDQHTLNQQVNQDIDNNIFFEVNNNLIKQGNQVESKAYS